MSLISEYVLSTRLITRLMYVVLFVSVTPVAFGMSLSYIPSVNEIKSSSQPSVPYCIDPNWMPYEGLKDGVHTGLSSDYLKLIQQSTGLDFQLVKTNSWSETLEFAKSGQCHLILLLNKTPNRDEYLVFTDVYYRAPNVLLSQREQPFLQDLSHVGDRTLGVVENYRLSEYINRYFPDINTINVESEGAGVRLVAEGKIDIFAGSMLSLNARAQQYGYGNLKIAGWAGPEDELRVGIIKSRADLIPIINTALASVTEQHRIEVFKKWNNARIIKEFDYSLTLKILIGLLTIIFLFILRQIQLNKFNLTLMLKNEELETVKKKLEDTNHHLEYLSFHDPLTDLYNRHYFVKHLEDHIVRLKRSNSTASLLLIDIDFFKQVNDKHGHAMGDKVLQALSTVLKNVIRESDTAGRWGGEEFLILMPDTELVNAEKLAKRIQKGVKDMSVEKVTNISVSIGIAQYIEQENFNQWFERTDQALYKAKFDGRDQVCIDESLT